MRRIIPRLRILSLAGVLCLAGQAHAADDQSPLGWSQGAARGILDLCRSEAPDAQEVVEHGEVWGWPRFMPFLETPTGYKREAGGESRRSYAVDKDNAEVEVTVQSGEVISAAPANIRYFRCNVASDQPINPDLEAYFTAIYGPPSAKTDTATVWLLDASAGAVAGGDDDAALAPVVAQGVGAKGERIELSRAQGRDRAKLTIFRNAAP
jgi:hypothetical protein